MQWVALVDFVPHLERIENFPVGRRCAVVLVKFGRFLVGHFLPHQVEGGPHVGFLVLQHLLSIRALEGSPDGQEAVGIGQAALRRCPKGRLVLASHLPEEVGRDRGGGTDHPAATPRPRTPGRHEERGHGGLGAHGPVVIVYRVIPVTGAAGFEVGLVVENAVWFLAFRFGFCHER